MRCECSFVFNDTATTECYTYRHTLSLHDALPIYMLIPSVKEDILAQASKEVKEIDKQCSSGLVTSQERYNNVVDIRSEEHTSELQSLMRNSYAVFCLKKKQKHQTTNIKSNQRQTRTAREPH